MSFFESPIQLLNDDLTPAINPHYSIIKIHDSNNTVNSVLKILSNELKRNPKLLAYLQENRLKGVDIFNDNMGVLRIKHMIELFNRATDKKLLSHLLISRGIPDISSEYELPSQPSLKGAKHISNNVANQTSHDECYAFAVARVILNFIKLTLVELNALEKKECDEFYNIDLFASDTSSNITPEYCGENEYNNLCLYMFIYYTLIVGDRGCGGNSFIAMRQFCESINNKTITGVESLKQPYLGVARELIETFIANKVPSKMICHQMYICHPQYNTFKTSIEVLRKYPEIQLLVFNFIKNLIMRGLYICISTDVLGDETKNFLDHSVNRVKYSGITAKYNELYKCDHEMYENADTIGLHSMVIVDYVEDESAFIIKNSWGREWGDSGKIKISIYELFTHLYFEFSWVEDEGSSPDETFEEFTHICMYMIKARENAKGIKRKNKSKNKSKSKHQRKLSKKNKPKKVLK